jgi:MFS family permease
MLAVPLLCGAIAVGAMMRSVLSPVQEAAKADLNLSDVQMSLVQGLAIAVPMIALSIPLGRLVDRSNRIRLLFSMGMLAVIGTVLSGLAHSFVVLFCARMMIGLGSVCILPAAISVAADLVDAGHRGRVLLILSLGTPLGTATGFAFGGWAAGSLLLVPGVRALFGDLSSWRCAHFTIAAFAAILLLPILAFPEPRRHEMGGLPTRSFGSALATLWTYRKFLLPLMIGQNAAVMADTAAGIWAAPVLVRNFGLRPQEFASWVALVMLLAGALGTILGGFAADLGQKSRMRGGVLLGAVLASAITVPAALFSQLPRIPEFAAGLALLLFCGSITSVATVTSVAILIPNELRGLCLSTFVVIGGVLGFGVAPTLVTLVSGSLGGASHLSAALAICGCSICACSFIAFILAFRNAATRVAMPTVP